MLGALQKPHVRSYVTCGVDSVSMFNAVQSHGALAVSVGGSAKPVAVRHKGAGGPRG